MENPIEECATRECVALFLFGEMCACADLGWPQEAFVLFIREAEARMQEIGEGR